MLGITECSAHPPITFEADMEEYPRVVAQAADVMRRSGIGGPYGLAISPEIYTGIVETTEHGGHLLFDHLRQILGGPLVWAPGVEGGVVVSLRGGDFVIDCGQDLSVGYLAHDAEVVRLYVEESLSFRCHEPDAAVALRPRRLTSVVAGTANRVRSPGRRPCSCSTAGSRLSVRVGPRTTLAVALACAVTAGVLVCRGWRGGRAVREREPAADPPAGGRLLLPMESREPLRRHPAAPTWTRHSSRRPPS